MQFSPPLRRGLFLPREDGGTERGEGPRRPVCTGLGENGRTAPECDTKLRKMAQKFG